MAPTYVSEYGQSARGNEAGQYSERSHFQYSGNRYKPARCVTVDFLWRGGVTDENAMLRPGQARVVHSQRLPIGYGPTTYGLQGHTKRAQESPQVIIQFYSNVIMNRRLWVVRMVFHPIPVKMFQTKWSGILRSMCKMYIIKCQTYNTRFGH